jgi:Ca2+-binding EF-hand superfamily protein
LDKDESREFIKDTVGNIDAEFNEEAYENLFNEFDEDGSGTLEKSELFLFV